MKHIFLLRARDEDIVRRLMEWYTYHSTTAQHIRRTLFEYHNRNPTAVVGQNIWRLADIVNDLIVEVPDLNAAKPVATELTPSPRRIFTSKLFKRKDKKKQK